MARGLVILAWLLLTVPAVFVAAKGFSALRRRQALVQGRTVTGAPAVLAGLILLAWAAGMLGFAALIVLRQLGR